MHKTLVRETKTVLNKKEKKPLVATFKHFKYNSEVYLCKSFMHLLH